MSAKIRDQAARLAVKYARVFNLPQDQVRIEFFIDERDREDAEVFATDLPVWTVGHE